MWARLEGTRRFDTIATFDVQQYKMKKIIRNSPCLAGNVTPPGDKSISQRAVLLNSTASGVSHVSNLCVGQDRVSILRCMRALGVKIRNHWSCDQSGVQECFEINGVGSNGFTEPQNVLNTGNSGTTTRLITGLLAAQPFFSVVSGDKSLRSRPMDRIVKPLRLMGAQIMGRGEGSVAPLAIRGGGLKGIEYSLPVSSAQVKSSLMIAGLYGDGSTIISQPSQSRDHTERMLVSMDAKIQVDGLVCSVSRSEPKPVDMRIPGDISSAAFWLVAGCCHPQARIRLCDVGVNPTRAGIITLLLAMGARLSVENLRENDGGEPIADIVVETSDLRGIEIQADMIPLVVDELPIIALAATCAKGNTVIAGAAELRIKESDRIVATVDGLSRLGANIEERPDGMIIKGGSRLSGAEVSSYADHRIAMTMGIAGLIADGETIVNGAEAVNVSYPKFWDTLDMLSTD